MEFGSPRPSSGAANCACSESEIAEQRLTVQHLQETTWGVRFHEEENGRFLVLPQGTVPATGWTVGGQPAVKLSSE